MKVEKSVYPQSVELLCPPPRSGDIDCFLNLSGEVEMVRALLGDAEVRFCRGSVDELDRVEGRLCILGVEGEAPLSEFCQFILPPGV